MSQNAKRRKLEALRERGATEGERQAAAAALDRIAPPDPGTPAWRAAQQAHQIMILECVARLGNPALSATEVRLVRNWARYIGHPWDRGAEELADIHRKLIEADDQPERALLSEGPPAMDLIKETE